MAQLALSALALCVLCFFAVSVQSDEGSGMVGSGMENSLTDCISSSTATLTIPSAIVPSTSFSSSGTSPPTGESTPTRAPSPTDSTPTIVSSIFMSTSSSMPMSLTMSTPSSPGVTSSPFSTSLPSVSASIVTTSSTTVTTSVTTPSVPTSVTTPSVTTSVTTPSVPTSVTTPSVTTSVTTSSVPTSILFSATALASFPLPSTISTLASSTPNVSVSTVSTLPSSSSTPTVGPTSSDSLPIIAGAAGGGLIVVLTFVLCCICMICCCRCRKRGKFIMKTAEGGTTLDRDYKLIEFNDGIGAKSIINKQDEATTETFGVKSPVQVDIGGQKFTFPDLPHSTEDLPGLIFLNPVKPTPNTYSGGSSTLPSRKKNKAIVIETDSSVGSELFGVLLKQSKSTSEINQASKAQLKEEASTIYDIPHTFKPAKADVEEKKAVHAQSNEYVMMEPRSKHLTLAAAADDSVSTAQQLPKNGSDLDRLAPRPLDPGAHAESIYDNARLLKSRPLFPSEPPISVQVNKNEAHSLYDVPKNLLASPSTFTKESGSAVEVAKSEEKPQAEMVENLYDTPDELAPSFNQISESPVSVPKTESVDNPPKKSTQSTAESQPEKSASNTEASSMPVILPELSSKPESKDASNTVNGVSDDAMQTAPSSEPAAAGSGSSMEIGAALTTKPSIPLKPSLESANQVASVPSHLVQALADSRIDKNSSSKDNYTEKITAPPLLLPKPNSIKPSRADKPSISPKPGITKKPVISPKPVTNEKDATTDPVDATKHPKEAMNGTSSDKGTPSSESPEPCVDSPQRDSDSSSSSPAPKPGPKPRKAAPPQFGMPQNVMQELFTKQSSRTKLMEEKSTPAAKPPVKPKPSAK